MALYSDLGRFSSLFCAFHMESENNCAGRLLDSSLGRTTLRPTKGYPPLTSVFILIPAGVCFLFVCLCVNVAIGQKRPPNQPM